MSNEAETQITKFSSLLVQVYTQVLKKITFKQVIKIIKCKIKHINQNMNLNMINHNEH